MDFRITAARIVPCMATSKGSSDLAAQHRDGKITLAELNAKAAEAGAAGVRQSNGGQAAAEPVAEEPAPSSS